MKKPKPITISAREIFDSLRKPLPKQTGGVHKDQRKKSRQEQKVILRRGEW